MKERDELFLDILVAHQLIGFIEFAMKWKLHKPHLFHNDPDDLSYEEEMVNAVKKASDKLSSIEKRMDILDENNPNDVDLMKLLFLSAAQLKDLGKNLRQYVEKVAHDRNTRTDTYA